jgi:hypothetical protein
MPYRGTAEHSSERKIDDRHVAAQLRAFTRPPASDRHAAATYGEDRAADGAEVTQKRV